MPLKSLNIYRDAVHNQAVMCGWYTDLETGRKKKRNLGEMLMLIVSEISEAMEGLRKDLWDDHLPDEKMEHVEIADAMIRIFDYAGYRGIDLDFIIEKKLEYNRQREDHKIENRKEEMGKRW